MASPTAAASTVRYRLTLRGDWLLDEEVCFSGVPRVRVMPELSSALPFAMRAVAADGTVLAVGPMGVDVAGRGDDCVTLTLDLKGAAQRLDDDRLMRGTRDVLVGSPDLFLWRPEPWPEDDVASLRIAAPRDVDVSLPFARDDDGAYRVTRSTWRLMSKAAFGRLAPSSFEAAGAHFSVVRLGTVDASNADVEAWLSAAARAVAGVSGRFPVDAVQVMLSPVPARGPVMFGMLARGGGVTSLLLMSKTATRDQLVGEWVAVHELSHLLLPPLKPAGGWLAEGSASYYQEVLRSRAGLIGERDAWQGLVDGFARGRAQAGDAPLDVASARMHKDFAYQHVYWGGAALMLLLDVELRQHGSSLDAAAARVRALQPRDAILRDADAVLEAMGSADDARHPADFVRAHLGQPFVDVGPTLRGLGVVVDGAGTVRLDDAAPLSSVRRAIAAPRGP